MGNGSGQAWSKQQRSDWCYITLHPRMLTTGTRVSNLHSEQLEQEGVYISSMNIIPFSDQVGDYCVHHTAVELKHLLDIGSFENIVRTLSKL